MSIPPNDHDPIAKGDKSILQSINELKDYQIQATDEEIGTVDDFLMDDDQHTIRYIVVQTGNWLSDRRVLISWASLGAPDRNLGNFPVKITREQVKNSPQYETALPFSRDQEILLHTHYDIPYYWAGGGFVGHYPGLMTNNQPIMSGGYTAGQTSVADEVASRKEQPGSNLISLKEVTNYGISAIDGSLGHVEDFIVDDQNWRVRYLVVDTQNWWPGKKVLVGIHWMDNVDWQHNDVQIGLSRDAIKKSPEYDRATSLNRDYETKIHDYYQRPGYWD